MALPMPMVGCCLSWAKHLLLPCHRQHPTTGTGKAEEAATTSRATPRWATGTEKHPFPGQSQVSPSHGTKPNGQRARGRSKASPFQEDWADCQTAKQLPGPCTATGHWARPSEAACQRARASGGPQNRHGHPDPPINRQDPTMGTGSTRPHVRVAPTTDTGKTRPRAWAAPDHGHGQHPAMGTGKGDHGHEHGKHQARVRPTTCPRQSQISSHQGTVPKGQRAMGKR